MTFGDFTESELETRIAKRVNDLKSHLTLKQHKRAGSDDGSELDVLSYNLSNSQVSAFKSSMLPLRPPVQPDRRRLLLIRLMGKRADRSKFEAAKALAQWRVNSISTFYSQRLQQASAMIDRMSRFSRNFISLNSLSSLFAKIKQRQVASAMIQLQRAKTQGNGEQQQLESELVYER